MPEKKSIIAKILNEIIQETQDDKNYKNPGDDFGQMISGYRIQAFVNVVSRNNY